MGNVSIWSWEFTGGIRLGQTMDRDWRDNKRWSWRSSASSWYRSIGRNVWTRRRCQHKQEINKEDNEVKYQEQEGCRCRTWFRGSSRYFEISYWEWKCRIWIRRRSGRRRRVARCRTRICQECCIESFRAGLVIRTRPGREGRGKEAY
jgi:hypothetical protein